MSDSHINELGMNRKSIVMKIPTKSLSWLIPEMYATTPKFLVCDKL